MNLDRAIWEQTIREYLADTQALMTESHWPTKAAVLIYDDPGSSCPTWTGKSEDRGEIRMNFPRDREPGAAAHELAHGVHERLRSLGKYRDRLVSEGNNGEEFAQMVRYEVERRRGSMWVPNQDRGMYERFAGNWQAFRRWVDGE